MPQHTSWENHLFSHRKNPRKREDCAERFGQTLGGNLGPTSGWILGLPVTGIPEMGHHTPFTIGQLTGFYAAFFEKIASIILPRKNRT